MASIELSRMDDGKDEDDLGVEGGYASLLQHQMSATWRSNLLPRSRYLELCVFKKMLARGLHLTRHQGGKIMPTTIFVDSLFEHLWWYDSVGTGYTELAIRDIRSLESAIDQKSQTPSREVNEIVTISEEEHLRTFSLVVRHIGGLRPSSAAVEESKGDSQGLRSEKNEDGGSVISEGRIFFVCESEDLYHLVVDGFEMLLEHSTATAASQHTGAALILPHRRLSPFWRSLLAFHQLYRPEHHPNHPRPVLRNGVEVEVLYSSEYVVEFNGQLMRLPNPFFAPGMYCNGRITSYDLETDNYTILYVNGPYEHDEQPDQNKRNFPRGTVFSFVKRAHIIMDYSEAYRPHIPLTITLLTAIQFIASLAIHSSDDEPDGMYSMQVALFDQDCIDVRGQIWRLWLYQLVPSSYIHLFYNVVVQVVFGLPINLVHGNWRTLLVYQMGVPVAALTVGFCVPQKIVSTTLTSFVGGVYAILGVHIGNLLLNWIETKHGLLNRWVRLAILAVVIGFESLILGVDPDPQTSPSMHAGALITGALASVVLFNNLDMTHFERTYLIPIAKWLLIAYIIFCVAWYIGFFPPRAIGPGFSGLDSNTRDPCCLKLLDCDIRFDDMDLFSCVKGGFSVQALSEDDGPQVSAQTCNAFRQYAGLQLAQRRDNSTR